MTRLKVGNIQHPDGTVDNISLTDTGRVGIGTTSPDFELDVNGTVGITEGQAVSWHDGSGNLAARIYATSGDELRFDRGSGASRSLTIDSSGRLLIGTSSSSATVTALLQGNSSGSTSWGALHLARGNANPSSNQSLGEISFTDSGHSQAGIIACVRDGGTWTSGSSQPTRLVFFTTADGAASPTEHVRIQENGNVRLTNLSTLFPIVDNAVTLGASGFRYSAVWAANGTIQTSDQRAKAEITDSQLGSDFIKSLRPVSYKWIEGGKRDTGERDEDNNYIYESVPGTRTHWGFIAQEVKQAVDATGVDFGGWVLTDNDDPDSQQALRYDQFIAPLTKALQEALAKIETLEQRLSDAGIA